MYIVNACTAHEFFIFHLLVRHVSKIRCCRILGLKDHDILFNVYKTLCFKYSITIHVISMSCSQSYFELNRVYTYKTERHILFTILFVIDCLPANNGLKSKETPLFMGMCPCKGKYTCGSAGT